MYSREIEGQEYTFGVSGKLIMNALVMYDRQTQSLWGQIIGEAVAGSLKGTKLEFIPAVHTTWADWKALHPDTRALVKGYYGIRTGYASYYRSPEAGVLGETFRDDRLYVKEFVIGVEQRGEAVAYPYGALNQQPVVNDTVGGHPILVFFEPDSAASAVFSRALGDGRVLSFSKHGIQSLTDLETSSTWQALSGEATGGPLAGTRLRPVKSTTSFWFGWKDWYPNTRVFGQ